MGRIARRLKHNLLEILPAVIYFFIVFSLFYLTFGWMVGEATGRQIMSFSRIIIGSLIIGKVMFVAGKLPFLNIFAGKPLVYSTVWKTSVYYIFALLFQVIEQMVPNIVKYKDVGIAWQYYVGHIWWPRFVTVQVWIVVLFFIFVMFQEFSTIIGRDKLRQIFIGR